MKRSQFTGLGIDVGGTKIAAGIVEFPGGDVIAERTISTRPERGGEKVLADVADLAETLVREAGVSNVEGTGVGLCEIVEPSGRIASGNCLRWEQPQVQEALKRFAPVFIEADVRAAAQAEALFGAGQEFRVFLYVTVGTGISSCLVIGGSPYLGASGATGTMASSPITVPCDHCGKETSRTLEEIASGPALAARYNRLKPGAALAGSDVVTAALNGDTDASRIVTSAAEALGSTAGLLVNVLDPEGVIIGGGLGLSAGPYWEHLVASTRRHIWLAARRSLPILRAQTGERAGVIGAAAVAWQHARRSVAG